MLWLRLRLFALTLLAMLRLAPTEPHARLAALAAQIAAASGSAEDAAFLTTVSLYETTFGRSGVPFGACGRLCRRHCAVCRDEPVVDTARWALGVWRLAGARTTWIRGPVTRATGRFAFYHGGAVDLADDYARREARTLRRLLGRMVDWGAR